MLFIEYYRHTYFGLPSVKAPGFRQAFWVLNICPDIHRSCSLT